jgi:5-methylcytosine-specific restriction endonuclease McrA
MDYFGYDTSDFIPCEVCEARATDIHHIEARGMGGRTSKDNIFNLMALCRPCHIKYGDITDCKEDLKKIHKLRMDIGKI